ncbi:UrcA family protein [Aurantiacibacter hainanensis]|uniref:UrcA family protein n=1 Tax=Aurantiacibacter hainanensis TaxID=3076114 RepID=UPI0030C69108
MKTISIKSGIAAALTAGALMAAPAYAANIEGHSVQVRYADLDLSTKEGQETLERRLDRAAQEVCGIDRRTSAQALPTSESRSCYRETIKNFEREIAVRTAEQQRG